MTDEARARIVDPEALAALTHPMRTKLLDYLMAEGPATASQAARAVGDTPSNSSYHLRILAKFGWVAPGDSPDGRERPWQALVTGFEIDHAADRSSPAGRNAAALIAMTVQQSQQEVREALTRYPSLDREWQDASSFHTYTLRATPEEMIGLTQRIDAVLRPFIAATRDQRPAGSALVTVGFQAFPKETRS
jgi:hypothetical protein